MSSKNHTAIDVQQAVQDIEASTNLREVVDHLAKYASQHGFTNVGLGHIVNPLFHSADRSNVFQLSTWAKDWVEHWMRSNVLMRDPVARYARVMRRPFRWSDAFENSRFMDRKVEFMMREFGFGDGMAFPMRTDDRPPGCVSFGADKFELSVTERDALEVVSIHAYSKIERIFGTFPYQPPVTLTAREREILHFAAAGKTNWEIGEILSISEYSVRDHIKGAARKLGTRGRTHTVAFAIHLGLILP